MPTCPRLWRVVAYCSIALWLGGCASTTDRLTSWVSGGWVADYDTAEKRVEHTRADLLIHYRESRPQRNDPLDSTLQGESVRGELDRYVRCRLSRAYEPDRRYVAQFGVQRAPALIVVHGDGTFHARTGPASTEEILAFLRGAVPPGRAPVLNPYVPRSARYTWLESLDTALERSRNRGAPLMAVYYRSLSRDWARLEPLLADATVARHLTDMVLSRIAVGGWMTEAYITPFGALQLPALVMAEPNGTFTVLEKPTSSDMIARFARTAISEVRDAGAGSTASASP